MNEIEKLIKEYQEGNKELLNTILEKSSYLIYKALKENINTATYDYALLYEMGKECLIDTISNYDGSADFYLIAKYALIYKLKNQLEKYPTPSISKDNKTLFININKELNLNLEESDYISVRAYIETLPLRTKLYIKERFGYNGRCLTVAAIAIKFNQNSEIVENTINKFINYLKSKYLNIPYENTKIEPNESTKKVAIEEQIPLKKSIFEYFNESREEVTSAISKLNKKDIIYLKYGNDLNEYNDIDSTNNNLIANTLIDEIKQILIKQESKTSFFSIFMGYTKEQVLTVIMHLPDNYKKIIFKRFGHSLSEYYYISKEENKILEESIIPSIYYDLKRQKNINNIMHILDCTNLDLIRDNLLKLNSYEQNLVIKRFSKEYNNNLSLSELINLYLEILPNLRIMIKNDELSIKNINLGQKKRLENREDKSSKPIEKSKIVEEANKVGKIKPHEDAPSNKKSKTYMNLFELLSDYSKEDIINAVNKLSEEDKTLIYSRYGTNLNEYHRQNKKVAAYVKIHVINNLLIYLNEGSIEKTIRKFFQNHTIPEIKEAIFKLPTKQRRVAINKFGENIDTINFINEDENEYHLLKAVFININRILNGETITFNYTNLTLLELLPDFKKELILEGINDLNEYERKCLIAKYGNSLEEINKVPKNIEKSLRSLINKLKKILEKKNNKIPSIFEHLGLSRSIVIKRIENLEETEKTALYDYYDYNLDNPTKKDIDPKIRLYVEHEIIPKLKKPLKSELNTIKDLTCLIKSVHSKNLLLQFTEEEILVIYLYKMVKENENSINYILNILDLELEDFNNTIKNAKKKNSHAFEVIDYVISACMAEYENEKGKTFKLFI